MHLQTMGVRKRNNMNLHIVKGLGLDGEAPDMNYSMAEALSIAESIESECNILVVPPLTWRKKDRTYISVLLGKSVFKDLDNRYENRN